MNETNDVPEDLLDLFDAYVQGDLAHERLREFEKRLLCDSQARDYFVRYCRMHADLELEARARQASEHALETINESEAAVPAGRRSLMRWIVPLTAAAVLLAVSSWLIWKSIASEHEEMAWLINAQNCQWAANMGPAGDMQAGKNLRLESGLAEVCFQKGARILMEGPASLEIISANSARLRHGKLTAKVPESARGFQVVTPNGKVVDLGTEFALSVDADGVTDVYVYSGTVEAYADAAKTRNFVSLQERQGARIDVEGVVLKQAQPVPETKPFVRDIPVIVPRRMSLDFQRPIPETLCDAGGRGLGLTHRLPGTGRRLKTNDDNLFLNVAERQLELKTTNSDLNTKYKLDQGEYLGIKLTDLGFTGTEDFALMVVVPNIPALQKVGQFGLYAGIRSDHTIRGGLLSRKEPEQYRQFLVQNQGGKDAPPHFVGLSNPGDDIRLTLRREGKKYALTVENLTTGNSTILTMPQPNFLEQQRDMYVGFFGANTQSEVRRTLILKEFTATVWTKNP